MTKPTFLTQTPIAHRGLHDAAKPENSLAAFRAAIERGYAIETDVRLTKDNRLVVFHDDTLTRMTGITRRVNELTAEELSKIPLAGTNERIPLFSEFLKELDGKAPLLLEIKNESGANTKAFIGKISEALEGYGGEYAVQSFVPAYVKEFKRLRPEILCGILGTAESKKEDFGGSRIWRIKAHVVKNMSFNKKIKPDFISYHFTDYPQKATEKFKGIKLAWTIRSAADEKIARRYADNIIFENYHP
ncbi:MAG: phosphodiesterase [Clostridia bacterium]|nr:phosphodiesterase [Clostridia bacterium]